MKRIVFAAAIAVALVSCKGKTAEKAFEVNGTITNNSGTVYLVQIEMGNQQGVVVDSAKVGKDGKYAVGAPSFEACVYNLQLGRSSYPFAAVINDVRKITVDVTFNKENNEFPEKYDVKGSEASTTMKDFMSAFNSRLQGIYLNEQKRDSLQGKAVTDSAVLAVQNERMKLVTEARLLADSSIQQSNNPALTMFILGYYQSTANIPAYGLAGYREAEVKKIVDDLAAKFPGHSRLAAIKKTMTGWVGQQAPDFGLPDPDGKEIKLSSYRGKYVLVDFWASWCKPCRDENPNVVKAFNKFKGKNFAILGVSLDRPGDKDKWLSAVMKDNLTWTHVSDLMEWNSPVVSLYNFGQAGIPYNILVDPEGKIIGERLYGPELEAKLGEVLK